MKLRIPLSVGSAVFLLFAPASASAQAGHSVQPSGDPVVDSVVRAAAAKFMGNPGKVALSIGVLDRGHRYRYNFGEVAPGSGKAPSSQTLYEIGSITKTFTGLLLARAVVDHKVDLNEDVRRYLKGSYPNLQYKDGAPMKVAYVAAHISQLPRSTVKPIDENFTAADFEQELYQVQLDSVQPYKYGYSNFGYQLLGVMLENVYGKSYDELVRSYIAGPWRMPSTRVYGETKDLIRGYDVHGNVMPSNPPNFPAAGGLRSNVDDLLNYVEYELRADEPAVRLSQHLMFVAPEGANALPWAIGRTRAWDYYVREDGGTKGFRTFIAMFPEQRVGIVVLSNETDENAGGQLYDLLMSILSGVKKLRD